MSVKKQFLIGQEARDKMLEGAKAVYDLVSPTSGPKGRNIAFARPWGLPRIINDGIEIAKEVGSEDEYINVGIDLIREAAQNTVTDAGDGTTTSIILAYHILKLGDQRAKTGVQPMDIREQIENQVHDLLKEVPKLATVIKTKEELEKVALISSSGDHEIASVVADAVFQMGVDGIVTSEEGNGTSITSEITKGMQLQKGYLDPMLVTDDMRMESVIIKPAIIVFEKVVTSANEIVPIMDEVAKVTKNVVIFGDIRGDALAVLILNKMRGVFQILAVNPPGYQEQRLAVLQDIAAVTGAMVITAATQSFHYSHVGGASHVTANKTTTTIVEGKGAKAVIDSRAQELRSKLEQGDLSLYEREKYEERLSKISSGVALIKVGAKSETLKREKFEKVKDAIGASKAALAEGIVVGGGMAFIKLARLIAKQAGNDKRGLNEGQQILHSALIWPTRKLLENSGFDSAKTEQVIDELLVTENPGDGFNVRTGYIEDLMKSGVVDPIRVIRLALENAATVATSMLTAEGVITDIPKKENQQQQQ